MPLWLGQWSWTHMNECVWFARMPLSSKPDDALHQYYITTMITSHYNVQTNTLLTLNPHDIFLFENLNRRLSKPGEPKHDKLELTSVTTVPSSNLSFLGTSSYPNTFGSRTRHAAQYSTPKDKMAIPTRQYLSKMRECT
jgi:hypothetical protein